MATKSGKLKWVFGTIICLVVLVVVFVLASNIIVNRYQQYVLANPSEVNSVMTGDPATAVVLGSGVDADGNPGEVLVERLNSAIELYDNGSINQIIVSGYVPTDGFSEPQVMQDYLIAEGIPEEKIIQDLGGYDTFATCRQTANTHRSEKAVFISQNSHIDRVLYLCRSLGIEAYGYAAEIDSNGANIIFQTVRETAANAKAVIDVILN